MPYDEGLAERLRDAFDAMPAVAERRMFGGLAFMVAGNMCCGVVGETLMVRVGPDVYRDALTRPHTREMDFTGKALKGFVFVDSGGIEEDADLSAWVALALDFVTTLPPK